ncbi:MAG: MBL fold metallo-hydrolase [Stellaceae bacterium]|jgi:flavorubredoxin
MAIVNSRSGTRVDEVEERIYRISTSVTNLPGGFSFNQYLIDDDEPLLFHTGPRKLFPFVREAVGQVLPVERLRHIAFSHFEADECGSLNEFLAAAPGAAPLCGTVAALVSVNDVADREARALVDGEIVRLGRREVQWFDTPHMPHAWECGVLFEHTTRTLLCSDLFTDGGADHPAITEADILGPSERFRAQMDYYSHAKNGRSILMRLAALRPEMLARMHGSAWRGDGEAMLTALAAALDRESSPASPAAQERG